MKHILFVTDTYYPDSSATTTIVKRTAEELVKQGYLVDVYPVEISINNHFSYSQEHNGVRILSPDDAVWKLNENSNSQEDNRDIRFQNIVTSIKNVLNGNDYDYIFSVAVAFEVNILTWRAMEGRKFVWFPMSYDPYAYNPHITEQEKRLYIQQEIEVLKDATRIFFLTEFQDDYLGSPIENKIIYFNLPCIRSIDPDRTKKAISFDDSFINCVFLGDFYYGVENTDFIFRLFEKVNGKIRLYTVGNLGDYQETVEIWKQKLGDKYICCSRISQEEAHNVMLDCDVLVSMGHDSSNMCPSKAIDFVSSGKPILHISKIPNCCAKKYLEKYPNKYCIYQNVELTPEIINEVEQFVFSSKGKERIPYCKVEELYSDFTMDALINKILYVFNEL